MHFSPNDESHGFVAPYSAVGNVVVQYAKNVLGIKHVVAIAGSQSKCEWLLSLGADAAVNYKSPSFEKELEVATPDGIDL